MIVVRVLWGAGVLALLAVIAYVLVRGGPFLQEPRAALLVAGGPVALLVLLFAVRIWWLSALPALTMSLAAAAAALLAADAVLLAQYAGSLDAGEFAASRLETLEGLRGAGRDAQILVHPKGLTERAVGGDSFLSPIRIGGEAVLPLAGAANTTTVMCRRPDGGWQTFESDEHGFSNPPGSWSRGAVEIVAVGDSHVQGWCVAPSESFLGRIRAAVPATANLGVAGNGPLADLGVLREFAAPLTPARVLWLFTAANDLGDLSCEARTPLLASYLERGFRQGLPERQAAIDEALAVYTAEAEALGSTISGLVPREVIRRLVTLYDVRQALGLSRGAIEDVDFALLRRVLETAQHAVESWGGTLIFVYLPSRAAINGAAAGQTTVLRLAAELGLPTIDVTGAFRNHPDPPALFEARTGTHYSPEGHALVAATVLAVIAP